MRIKLNMDQDWKLFVGDLSPRTSTEGWGGAKARAYDFGATAISLDDSGWTATDVPNDFVVSGDYTRKSAGENELPENPGKGKCGFQTFCRWLPGGENRMVQETFCTSGGM